MVSWAIPLGAGRERIANERSSLALVSFAKVWVGETGLF